MDELRILPSEAKDVFEEGIKAFVSGEDRKDNPYQDRVEKVRAEFTTNVVLACLFDKGWLEGWKRKENPSDREFQKKKERWD